MSIYKVHLDPCRTLYDMVYLSCKMKYIKISLNSIFIFLVSYPTIASFNAVGAFTNIETHLHNQPNPEQLSLAMLIFVPYGNRTRDMQRNSQSNSAFNNRI